MPPKSHQGERESVLYRFIYAVIQFGIILAVIAFMPGLPPDAQFKYYKVRTQPIPSNLRGELNNAEKLFVNQVKGPEDFAVYKNELYFTTHLGYVQKISKGKLVPVVKFGKDCEGFHEEHICGRPLGLRFDSKGSLYVADAYYGIFKVNVSTGEFENLVSPKEPIEGIPPTLPNSVAISEKTGNIYWTDSSTSHRLYDGFYNVLTNGNGRLIKYNIASRKNEVLLKNLHFPNGLALSTDESFILLAETLQTRLLKYHLKGPKARQFEVFANTPGLPDNIHFGGGKFTVSYVVMPNSVINVLAEWPVVRKLIARVLTLFELVIDGVGSLYSSDLLKKTSHMIGHFELANNLFTQTTLLVQIFNEKGKLLETMSATDQKLHGASSLIEHGGYYYLASPFNNFLARVKIV